MGDPRKLRKKYNTPKVKFERQRIKEEFKLVGEYGLRNKTELWKHRAQVSHYRSLTRSFRKLSKEMFEQKFGEIRKVLTRMGLIKADSTPDEVLNLTTENILGRRLQTIVFKKGFAKTIYQARQLVVHSHIAIKDRIVDTPSHLCTVEDEQNINYAINSPFRANKDKLFSQAAPAVKEEKAAEGEAKEEPKDEGEKKE